MCPSSSRMTLARFIPWRSGLDGPTRNFLSTAGTEAFYPAPNPSTAWTPSHPACSLPPGGAQSQPAWGGFLGAQLVGDGSRKGAWWMQSAHGGSLSS